MNFSISYRCFSILIIVKLYQVQSSFVIMAASKQNNWILYRLSASNIVNRGNIMNKETTAIIKQQMVPLMEEHGFSCTFYSDGCCFERKSMDQEKTQLVWITDFKNQSYVQFQANTFPTFLYSPTIDLEKIIVKEEKMPKRLKGKWFYKTCEDVEKIIEIFAKSMKLRGFKAMDTILNDSRDICPKSADYEEMYHNHGKYAEEFHARYKYDPLNTEASLAAIQKAIDEFPGYITNENHLELFPVIAAYGEFFVVRGGEWVWYEDSHTAKITVPKSKINTIANPFGAIYSCIQNHKSAKIKEAALMNLRNLEYFLQKAKEIT